MISVTQAVQQVVDNSEFARTGLRLGLLNISAYAKMIRPDVESIAKKEIKSDSSIVMALSRYGAQLRETSDVTTNLQIENIVSRSKLVELAYTKTRDTQEKLAMLSLLEVVRSTPFFVSTIGMTEVAVIIDMSLASVVEAHFGVVSPLVRIDNLASLTLKVGLETINLPGQSYRVLEQLASRNITVVEYATSPTELNIVLYEKDVAQAFRLLHGAFLK